ncbi:Transcription initiation factor TFIID subunit 12 domain - like 1 [Theobroma cacao]|nr:Transcription initiation factor TFIID subunit 12 domain - like 1 [Theobroma cacao]
MDQQPPLPSPKAPPSDIPTPTPTPTPIPTSSTTEPPQQPPPSLPQPPQPPQIQQPIPTPTPPSATPSTSSSPSSNPNPNPIPKPLSSPSPPSQQPPQPKPTLPAPQPRPTTATSTTITTTAFSRPWQQHSSQFTHFSSSSPSVSSSPSPTLSSQPRGSFAIGVPSSHSSPSPPTPSPSQPNSFSGSFGHSFGGGSSSNVSQARQPIQGMGMVGSSIGSSSQMRPGGLSAHHQQRPVQSSLRPPSSTNSQSPATQNFQGHGLMRVSAVGTSGSSTPSTPQTTQSLNQPWLSSGAQGKPPLPPPSYRPQINSPSLQQRSHISQQHHSLPTVSQQQHVSSPQVPQPLPSHQQQEHFGQQFSQSRVPQSLPHQQQVSRAQGSANQKPSSLAMIQPSIVQPLNQNKAAITESDESGGRILSKRSVHDLVNQIDPSEKLDPEVEDILVDIAEDFVDSITTFGCSLAKHRKSDTLEAKDILLHLERNWHMTLPGFCGDEIKTYRKPVKCSLLSIVHTGDVGCAVVCKRNLTVVDLDLQLFLIVALLVMQLTNEIHKERLAAIKKSILVTEATNTKHFGGQAAVNAKGNLGKAAANILGSPNVKIREVT